MLAGADSRSYAICTAGDVVTFEAIQGMEEVIPLLCCNLTSRAQLQSQLLMFSFQFGLQLTGKEFTIKTTKSPYQFSIGVDTTKWGKFSVRSSHVRHLNGHPARIDDRTKLIWISILNSAGHASLFPAAEAQEGVQVRAAGAADRQAHGL